MIRVNLLAGERAAVKKKSVAFNLAGQKMTIAASLILVVTAAGIGWRYWSLTNQSKRLDEEISAAQQETVVGAIGEFVQRRVGV